MHKDLAVALNLALVILTGIGTDLVVQVQMLMAMVVALGAVKMVAVAAVHAGAASGYGNAKP